MLEANTTGLSNRCIISVLSLVYGMPSCLQISLLTRCLSMSCAHLQSTRQIYIHCTGSSCEIISVNDTNLLAWKLTYEKNWEMGSDQMQIIGYINVFGILSFQSVKHVYDILLWPFLDSIVREHNCYINNICSLVVSYTGNSFERTCMV